MEKLQVPDAFQQFISEKTTAKAIKADLAKSQAHANQIAVGEKHTLHDGIAPTVTAEQLNIVQNTIAKDATAEELQLFLYDCARQGVHPLDRLIHFTKRSGKYAPITSIDFMRIRADSTGQYAGNDDPVYGDSEGLPEHPVTATVTVWRVVEGQRCPFTATARWAEYKPDQHAFMWQKMPFLMLGKCAEALALRKGFPKQLAGLYAKEEMDQAENGEPRQKAAPKSQDAPRREREQAGSTTENPVLDRLVRSGAIRPSPAVPANVDPVTGEEYPPCPAGAVYVLKYAFDRGMHTALISDMAEPEKAREVQTKFDQGLTLKAACETKRPVVVMTNAKGFATRVDWYVPSKGPVAKKLATAMREDEPPLAVYDEEVL